MRRKAVGVRELKTRLGGYLRQVRRGLTLIVTERGEPVAELRPIGHNGQGESAKLGELVQLGVLTREKGDKLKRFLPIRAKKDVNLSGAVVEGREDRV